MPFALPVSCESAFLSPFEHRTSFPVRLVLGASCCPSSSGVLAVSFASLYTRGSSSLFASPKAPGTITCIFPQRYFLVLLYMVLFQCHCRGPCVAIHVFHSISVVFLHLSSSNVCSSFSCWRNVSSVSSGALHVHDAFHFEDGCFGPSSAKVVISGGS
jgi:hypothetical protein